MRKGEADIGRLSGRLSHLFTLDYPRAVENRDEIHATLRAMRAETREPRAAIARLLDNVAAALDA